MVREGTANVVFKHFSFFKSVLIGSYILNSVLDLFRLETQIWTLVVQLQSYDEFPVLQINAFWFHKARQAETMHQLRYRLHRAQPSFLSICGIDFVLKYVFRKLLKYSFASCRMRNRDVSL